MTKTLQRRMEPLLVQQQRMTTDLYSNVGQVLYYMGLRLQDVLLRVEDPELVRNLIDLRALAAQGVRQVRTAMYEFSCARVKDLGLVPSLRALARQFITTSGVEAKVQVKGQAPPGRLPPATESVLYRVAYEALVNVERHARATGVAITFTQTKDRITLTIRDDGVGIKNRQGADWQSAASFGLKSMARWMADVGGTLRVAPAYPRGLLIEATVPLHKDQQEKKIAHSAPTDPR